MGAYVTYPAVTAVLSIPNCSVSVGNVSSRYHGVAESHGQGICHHLQTIINERPITLRVRGRIFHIKLVCTYAPTEEGTPDAKEGFYEHELCLQAHQLISVHYYGNEGRSVRAGSGSKTLRTTEKDSA